MRLKILRKKKENNLRKDKEKKHSHPGSFLHGTFFGVIAGTIIGLLVAPDKGEATKEKVKTKAKELNEKAQPVIEKAKIAAEEIAQIVEENETLDNIKKKILKEKDKEN